MPTSNKIRRPLRDAWIPSAEEQSAASSPVSLGNEADSEFSGTTIAEEYGPVSDAPQIKREPSSSGVPAHSEQERDALGSHCPTGAWMCGICSKYLNSKRLLQRHAHQVHHARQRYECDVCPKTYAYAKSLKEHKRFHTGEKPHACHLCPAAFARRSALQLHIQAMHDVAGHRACGECGKKFAFKSSLERHLRVHTGETPHGCHLCPRRFARTDRLLAHLRAHADESPHFCSQ